MHTKNPPFSATRHSPFACHVQSPGKPYFIEYIQLLDLSTAECTEEGQLWRDSSEPWNFYLTHQLNRTYVDTLGGRLDGVPSYPVIQRNTIEQQAGKRKPYSPVLVFPSQVQN